MDDQVNQWLKKIDKIKGGEADLSRDEDLSIALMNLVSLEEHFFFSAMKTNNQKYLDMLKEVRDIRKEMLKKIVAKPEGEEWCISKHLLAASMRLYEVGTKELGKNNLKEAKNYFKKAFALYSLFFAINLKMIKPEQLENPKEFTKEKSMFAQFSSKVKELIDCCKEW